MQRLAACLVGLSALASHPARAGDLKSELFEVNRRLRDGRPSDALELLRPILDTHPDALDAHALYQDVMLAAGNETELRATYEARVKERPQDPAARYLFARLLKGPRAVTESRAVVKLAPQFARGWLGLAGALKRVGRRDDAEAAARKAVSLDALSAEVHDLLGWLVEQRGDRKEAEALYRRALDLDPGSLPARFKLAHLLVRSDRGEAALEEIERARELAPGDPQVAVHRGLVQSVLGNDKEAAAAYEEAVGKAPADPLVLVLLAETCAELSEWDLASKSVARALELRPDFAPAYAARGYAALRRKDVAAAVEAYRQAARLAPGNASHYYYLGLATERAGNRREAVVQYRRAAQKDPGNALYRLALGSALEQSGRVREALAAYKEATKLSPDDPDAWIRLGHVCAGARQARQAVAAFEKARALAPDDVEILKSLGIVYEVGLRNLKEAARCYKEYVDKGGKDKRVAEWLAQIKPGK
ncbi:MAG: tetratricopeptide repeat protein [Planctomycetota bacterium]